LAQKLVSNQNRYTHVSRQQDYKIVVGVPEGKTYLRTYLLHGAVLLEKLTSKPEGKTATKNVKCMEG